MSTKYVRTIVRDAATEISGFKRSRAARMETIYGVIRKEEYATGDVINFTVPVNKIISGTFTAATSPVTKLEITPATVLSNSVAFAYSTQTGAPVDIAYVLQYEHGSGVAGAVNLRITPTITNINDAPVVANALINQVATEDSVFTYQFAANSFTDPESNSLTYTAALAGGGELPDWLTFTAGTRTFSGTPLAANVGTTSVTVTANDGALTITDTFDIVISAFDDAPVVAIPLVNQTATEDSVFTYQFAAGSFTDEEGPITYTAVKAADDSELPAWLTFTSGTRTFTGTPLVGDVGTLAVKVTATATGKTISDEFNIVVSAFDDAPVVAILLVDQDATENTPFSYQFAAGSFTDEEGTLSYTAVKAADDSALPTWLTFTSGTRTFAGIPLDGDAGTVSIKVTATATGKSVSDEFDIVIAAD